MDRFESLSKIAQDEFGITIKSKSPTGETFESLYCETKDSDRREKQIEAIAKVMCGGCPDNKECMHCICADWYKAESIYNADYRNQSEVVREIFEEIDNIISNLRDSPFYSSSDAVYELTELKKKYTEELGNEIQRAFTGIKRLSESR